ncbi:MAG TPA: hypothetical protein VIC62_16200 [Nakamurella sp.]|jgi:hypothetical protein
MNRRLAGLLIVLLTIVGVAVAAAPSERLPGIATAVEFPNAPAVGDCLIDPLDGATRFPFERDRPVPQYGSCAGHLTLGEVVTVQSPAPTDLAVGLDEHIGCRGVALTYAGLVERNGSFGMPDPGPGGPVNWQYSIAADTGWIGQIPWSPKASEWAVCVVRPIGLFQNVGTLAGSFTGGLLPYEYSTCWMSRDVTAAMRTINCSFPHVAELIAIGRVDDAAATDWERIVDSCTEQARLVERRKDPTADGLLAVHVLPDGSNPAGRDRNLTCFVTAADDRMLMGSLIGLAADQVRFAG